MYSLSKTHTELSSSQSSAAANNPAADIWVGFRSGCALRKFPTTPASDEGMTHDVWIGICWSSGLTRHPKNPWYVSAPRTPNPNTPMYRSP